MKFLIYILCLFVSSAINVFLDNSVFPAITSLASNDSQLLIYSGLCGLIYADVYVLGLFIIPRKLISVWKKHHPEPDTKERKAKDAAKQDSPAAALVVRVVTAKNPSKKSSVRSKLRYCKMCGGIVDSKSKKCTKCGKQYFRWHLMVRSVATVVCVFIVVSLVATIFVQYNQYQSDIAELNSTISSLQKEADNLTNTVSSQRSSISTLNQTISVQNSKITSLEDTVDNYDKLCNSLKSNNLGFASNNFKSDESVIVVSKNEIDRKFNLTAHWSNGGTVSVLYDSLSVLDLAATVSFDTDNWSKSTAITVHPHSEGVTTVTFSNSVDSETFKVIIVVTE